MNTDNMLNNNSSESHGPSGYELWKSHSAGEPLQSIVEFTLYSDAHITSEILEDLGPYAVLNTVAIARARRIGEPLPAMVLRCHIHGSGEQLLPDMSRRNDETWHAGALDDEMAALLSLALGIRVRSGGLTREFTDQDRLGTPRQHSHQAPYLPPAEQRRILPSATGTHRIDEAVGLISTYPLMSGSAAVTLVRAARAYQKGIWVVEEDPEYTWLKLVSCIETAADYWWQQDTDAVELFKSWDSELALHLEEAGGKGLLSEVAEKLVGVTRSSRKFLDFLGEYLPGPPPDRPATGQLDWSAISNGLQLVYKYRSQSLHGGKPFPGPLLSAPSYMPEPAERPLGLAAGVAGAVWMAKDLPMHLHVFEHIVRGALRAWWQDIAETPA